MSECLASPQQDHRYQRNVGLIELIMLFPIIVHRYAAGPLYIRPVIGRGRKTRDCPIQNRDALAS